MQLNSVGVAGEVRCVVTGSDGEVKTDTGYQKNLILNQGLDFFGRGKGNAINERCAIGSGNGSPAITQTKLDAFIAIAIGTDTTSDYSYVDKGDGMYHMWEQKKYRFTGLTNVNISEVGLVSTSTSSTDYYLTTRALLKDSLGAPTSISVKTGETLDIYYKIHKVVDTRDKAFVINVLDGDGGAVPYNVVVRPLAVGASSSVSTVLGLSTIIFTSTAELIAITETTGTVVGGGLQRNKTSLSPYVSKSYKNTLTISLGLGDASHDIRQFNTNNGSPAVGFSFLPFQMRLGRVSDDAPLTKTDKDTLTIPLEFSWGRYEGVL